MADTVDTAAAPSPGDAPEKPRDAAPAGEADGPQDARSDRLKDETERGKEEPEEPEDPRSVTELIEQLGRELSELGMSEAQLEAARNMPERIPNAKYVELEGEDQLWFVGDVDAIFDEVEGFLTGVRRNVVKDRVLATVLFTDMVDSTSMVAELGDYRWRELLTEHDALVRHELERFRGRELKTIGDGFLATFDGPARAVTCAAAIRDRAHGLGISMRAGVHTGECEVIGDDITGVAVNIAARISALAAPDEVLVSRTVTDLVYGSGIEFKDRGLVELKGVPDTWHLFAATTT
jgi:class 3 adenylate cyclase